MENAALIGLSRQVALGRELDVIANNMANVSTNGFKARSARFKEHLMPVANADAFRPADQRLSYVIDQGTPLDFGSGPIEHTGNALDLAIKGDALFVVQTPQGERYTRDGAFQLDRQGRLVNEAGHPVLGEGGVLTFSPQESGFQIAQDGTITTSQGQRGRVRLVRFDNPQALRNEGTNLYSAAVAGQPAGATSRIEAGALERSNVKPVLEMSRLVEVNRKYSSVAQMISRMDELRRSAITKLADAAA